MSDEEPPAEEQETVQVAIVAQGAADYLKELAAVLTSADVPHDIVAPPGCEPGSCGPALLLVTPPDALANARAAIETHWNSELADDERVAVETVVDFDAEETTCPACGTAFPTSGAERCPECGLNFGG